MRLKIIAGSLAVVVLVGLAAHLTVRGQLRTQLLHRIDDRIDGDRELAERSFRLSAIEFTDLVAQRAGERPMRDVFGGLDLASRRTRAYDAAEAAHAWFADPARGERGGPDIVVVVDETGTAIARNGARNVMFGTPLVPSLPVLASVLRDARAAHDTWLEPQHGKVLQTALAPIRADSGATLGALIVGYDLSNGVAQRAARVLGRDVAFLVDGKVYSSSLEGGAAKALRDLLFGPQAATTASVLAGRQATSEPWAASLGEDEYVGLTSRLPMASALPVAFAILGNRSEQVALADVANVILMLTALGAMLVGLYGFMMGNALMRPIEEIEEGVLAVINGRTDLRLEIDSAELGGLAFRINQLLNVLTGTEEETEDERGKISVRPSAANWSAAELSDAQSPAPAGATGAAGASAPGQDDPIEDPALSARLAAEDEVVYGARVYREYVSAKQSLGENVAGIPQERFLQRLAGRGDVLAKKHGCRLVRFHVAAEGGQVLLRPVLIR